MFISHDAIADSMNKLVGCWCIAHGCVNSSDNWLVLHGMAMQFHCFSRPMELIYMYIYCWCPYWRGYMTVTHINVCTSPYCCFNTVNVMHHESWNVQFSKWKHSINLILGINSYILYIHINQTRPDHMWIAYEFYILISWFCSYFSCCCFWRHCIHALQTLASQLFFPLKSFFFHFVPFDFRKSHKQTVIHENCSIHAHKIYICLLISLWVFLFSINFCLPDGCTKWRLIIIIIFSR